MIVVVKAIWNTMKMYGLEDRANTLKLDGYLILILMLLISMHCGDYCKVEITPSLSGRLSITKSWVLDVLNIDINVCSLSQCISNNNASPTICW